MKKIIYFILLTTLLSIFCVACSKSETYADKLKKQNKLIRSFLDKNNIKVLDSYPENGVFAENEFYKDPATGIYVHVVDSGNGERAVKKKTTVYMRYWDTYFLRADTILLNNNDPKNDVLPMSLTFGETNTYLNSKTSLKEDYNEYYFKSQACALPLEYVGNHAIVSLLIPFDVGSYYQQYSAYEPVYIGRLSYTFE